MNFNLTIGKSHDANVGGGYGRTTGGHPVTGKTRGMTFPMYQYSEEEEIENTLDDEELDDFVDVVNAIRAKTTSGASVRKDFGNRADRGDFTGTNVGGISSLTEFSDHTTTAVKGISPRLTYRTRTNTKGPAMGSQSNAMYIRSAPGRISGTQYGTSRSPLPRHNEDDELIFSLTDLKDPMERAFLKHQKNVNRVKNMIISLEES